MPRCGAPGITAADLLPGALTAFLGPRGLYGVPLSPLILGVEYRWDAFKRLRLPVPGRAWTFADFVSVCAALRSGLDSGRLRNTGVYGVLPPLLASTPLTMAGGRRQPVYGEAAFRLVWQAFALGFGGSTGDGHRFDFVNAGALKGFMWLVSLVRQFGAPPATNPDVAVFRALRAAATGAQPLAQALALAQDGLNRSLGHRARPAP